MRVRKTIAAAAFGATLINPNFTKYHKGVIAMAGPASIQERAKQETVNWEAVTLSIYVDAAKQRDIIENLKPVLKERSAQIPAETLFTNFMSTLSQSERRLLTLGLWMAIETPSMLITTIRRCMDADNVLKSGGTPSVLAKESELVAAIEKDLNALPASEQTPAKNAYKALLDYAGKDNLAKAILFEVLSSRVARSESVPALLYLKENVVDTAARSSQDDPVKMSMAQQGISSHLKGKDVEESKKVTDKFDELIGTGAKAGLLKPRERILFLHGLDRISRIEPEYMVPFITKFYDVIMKPELIGAVYDEMLKSFGQMWTDKLKENLQMVLEESEPGKAYTTREKILMLSLFNVSFIEAFSMKRNVDNLVTRLLRGAATGFARGAATAEQQQSMMLQYSFAAAMLRNTDQDASQVAQLAKNILIFPLLTGTAIASVEVMNVLVGEIITMVERLYPKEKIQVAILTSNFTQMRLMNDLYSLMEYATGMGMLGDKWKTTWKEISIPAPIRVIIENAIDTGIVDPKKDPLMVAQLYRLLFTATARTGFDPENALNATITAISEFRLTSQHVMKLNDALDFIAYRGYKLDPIIEAIFESQPKISFDDALVNAMTLANENKVIRASTLIDPKTAWRRTKVVPGRSWLGTERDVK